jgi:TRAP-type C4-dicarboxylate transport system permease small subunit
MLHHPITPPLHHSGSPLHSCGSLPVLNTIDRGLARLEKWLVVLFLSLMLFFTFVQVVLRGLYTHAHFQWANDWMAHIVWSEPFARLLVLWLAFIGASLVTGDGKHIKIDLFASVMPTRWAPVRDLVLSVACLAVCGVMFKVCLRYIALERSYGGAMFLQVPNWVGQLILPAGFGTMFFRFFLKAARSTLELRRPNAS